MEPFRDEPPSGAPMDTSSNGIAKVGAAVARKADRVVKTKPTRGYNTRAKNVQEVSMRHLHTSIMTVAGAVGAEVGSGENGDDAEAASAEADVENGRGPPLLARSGDGSPSAGNNAKDAAQPHQKDDAGTDVASGEKSSAAPPNTRVSFVTAGGGAADDSLNGFSADPTRRGTCCSTPSNADTNSRRISCDASRRGGGISSVASGAGGGGSQALQGSALGGTQTQISRLSRRSSLDLRKVPEHILLGPCEETDTDLDDEDSLSGGRGNTKDSFGEHDAGKDAAEEGKARTAFLQRTCLRPVYSLQKQMMLSFGIVSVLTVLFVVTVSIIVSVSAGNSVRSTSKENLRRWALDKASSSARYVSDAFDPMMPRDEVNIIGQVLRDRFAGYPDAEGYDNDDLVPFRDVDSGRNIYPIDAKNLTMDWNFPSKIHDSNASEHVGEGRWSWYRGYTGLSTEGSLFHMQGSCDPNVFNPQHRNYHPNCTDSHSDPTRGGEVHPVATTAGIYSRAKDLDPVLKALFEYSEVTKEIGVYFANSGAGATINFPHYELDNARSYTSVGCDWMREPNPYDPSQPIGTDEEIALCHPKGVEVRNNLYNPMERGWCRDFALKPRKIQFAGPFFNAWADSEWLMFIGRGEYDKVTNKFIGCTLVDIFVDHIPKIVDKVKISPSSQITLVKWDDAGTVVSSPMWDPTKETETTTVDDPKLGLGMSKETFVELKSIVDSNINGQEALSASGIRRAYEDATLIGDGKIVSVYPVPPPDDSIGDILTYDMSTYEPDFMVIVTLVESDIFASFYDLDATLDREVKALVAFALIVGSVGLALVMWIIFAVSLALTHPLRWMNSVADKIVNEFGNGFDLNKEDLNAEDTDKVLRFTPRTELSDLMREFKTLVSRFSGEGTARAVRFGNKLTEVRNRFTMLDEFEWLWKARKDAVFKFDYGTSAKAGATPHASITSGISTLSGSKISFNEGDPHRINAAEALAPGAAGDVPRRRYFGPNIHHVDADSKSTSVHNLYANGSHRSVVLKSPLFRWIVGLIVVPLIILSVIIASVVLWRVSSHFTELDEIVQAEYLQLEMKAMETFAHLRAVEASEVTGRAARDLHLHARVAGWLMFGGLDQAASFTEMDSAAEVCRHANGPGECEHVKNPPCDCAWKDQMNPSVCRDYGPGEDSRYEQMLFWEGEISPYANGDMNASSASFTRRADTKAWYENATVVPGNSKGASSSGHKTTYDRLRSMSATSPIQLALYNYDTTDKNKLLGSYIGFEADGSFMGYAGCDHGHADRPFFRATEENGAARMRPDLCPLGSYGYDARCRDWYDTGKAIGTNLSLPSMYVSPPYVFAGIDLTAQSCGMPLIDPTSGQFVGQILVDFMPNAIMSSLSNANTELVSGGFPILVTTRADIHGHDTVIGPDFVIGDPGTRIEDLVTPHDPHCQSSQECMEKNEFYAVVCGMREGRELVESFRRTRPDGSSETIIIAFAPVNVSSFRPLNHSDYRRGVEKYDDVIYSLALAQPQDELLRPFQDVRGTVQRQVNISIAILAAVITVATVFLLYVSSSVTVSITVPMMHLLGLLKNANQLESKDDMLPPEDATGSREVLAVYDTFSMLFKVIRFANSAFFTGDVERAYHVLVDALKLFKSLDNEKAIGVASNNLGNCMLTMYRTMKEKGQSQICGMNRVDIIAKGTAYFRDSIKLGEKAYDAFYAEQGWSGSCLVFMQHLSSRYFNRAMFFLTVKGDHRWPQEANRLGFRDLDIAKNMDVEVADQCVEVGFNVDPTEQFDLMLSRMRGLLSLKEMGYPDEWDMEELIEESFAKLKAAIRNPSSDFFRDISPAGRMQQFDAELIKDALLDGRKKDAAVISIRMLIEDEYAFHEAESVAIDALVQFVKEAKSDDSSELTTEAKNDLIAFQENFEAECTETISRRIAHVHKGEGVSLNTLKTSTPNTFSSCGSAPTSRGSASLKYSCRGDFTMEVF